MKNAPPPLSAYKKKILTASDLKKDEFINRNHQILDTSIDDCTNEIDGVYSVFCSQQVIFWEGKLHTKSRILLSYPPEILSTHFYLLYFKSSNTLNIRVNLDIPVNEGLLNSQSGSGLGSFLWASNVGVEVLIPPDTQVDFQLIVVSKEQLLEQMANKTLLQREKLLMFGKSNVPLFFYSKETIPLPNMVNLQTNSINFFQKRVEILDLLIEYFSFSINISNEKCSLWDFQNILIIEQFISQLPIAIKPNLAQLSKDFNYPRLRISKLFRHLFGKSTAEYHCAIHMEYVAWLLEIEPLNIYEISRLLDCKDSRMFSRRFKSYYSVPPKVYKSKS